MISVTVRDDGPVSKLVIIHDGDGNEIGWLNIDQVPKGVRVSADDTNGVVGTLVLRK